MHFFFECCSLQHACRSRPLCHRPFVHLFLILSVEHMVAMVDDVGTKCFISFATIGGVGGGGDGKVQEGCSGFLGVLFRDVLVCVRVCCRVAFGSFWGIVLGCVR